MTETTKTPLAFMLLRLSFLRAAREAEHCAGLLGHLEGDAAVVVGERVRMKVAYTFCVIATLE